MIKLILTCASILAFSLAAVGCGDNLPDSGARYLRSHYDILRTQEESRCNSHITSHSWGENPGEMHAGPSDLRPGTTDIFFTWGYSFSDEVWYSDFQGVTIGEDDGYFEGWSHYSFLRQGEVIVSTFETIKGTVTVEGIVADHALYIMDTPENTLPTCSFTQHIESL